LKESPHGLEVAKASNSSIQPSSAGKWPVPVGVSVTLKPILATKSNAAASAQNNANYNVAQSDNEN
jgi:hypothetical protein